MSMRESLLQQKAQKNYNDTWNLSWPILERWIIISANDASLFTYFIKLFRKKM